MKKLPKEQHTIDYALRAVKKSAESLRSKDEPEFMFITKENGKQLITQNASVEFTMRVTLSLLLKVGLSNAIDVIEMFETIVDDGGEELIEPTSRTLH